MSGDRYDYLTRIEGLTHELFGGDPDEIVLRVASMGEGAGTLGDFARDLRGEAGRYERLQRDGWRLVGPFTDGEARCRKTAEAGEEAPPDAQAAAGADPTDLRAALDGAGSLPEAAGRLRAAADTAERLHQDGRRLAGPVAMGRARLR